MHRILSTAVVSVFATLSSQACFADDQDGRYMVLGAPSCGDYIASQRPGDDIAAIRTNSWMAGYVSAYNAWVPKTYDILGSSGGMDGLTA